MERVRPTQRVRSRQNELSLLLKPPLLLTESSEDFDALREAVEEETKPQGVIERMYIADFIAIFWEILRLQRCKVAMINSAFHGALRDLLAQLIEGKYVVSVDKNSVLVERRGSAASEENEGEYTDSEEDQCTAENEDGHVDREKNAVCDLARDWFTDRKAKQRVSEILASFDLNEAAIEAEAVRRVLPEIRQLDRMISLSELRRNKALRSARKWSERLARKLQETTDRVKATDQAKGKEILLLPNSAGKRASAA